MEDLRGLELPALEGHFQVAYKMDDERRIEIGSGFHRSTTHALGTSIPADLVSLFIGLLFIGGMWSPELDTSELPYQLLFFFSVPMHFQRHFARGLIDTRHLVLYGSVALYGLFLTVCSLESRRWR